MSKKKQTLMVNHLRTRLAIAMAEKEATENVLTAYAAEQVAAPAAAAAPPPTVVDPQLAEYRRLKAEGSPFAGVVLLEHPRLLSVLEAERRGGSPNPPRAA